MLQIVGQNVEAELRLHLVEAFIRKAPWFIHCLMLPKGCSTGRARSSAGLPTPKGSGGWRMQLVAGAVTVLHELIDKFAQHCRPRSRWR